MKIESFFHLTNNLSYPLVIALSILVFPAMVIRHRLGWTRLILLDFPLFFISTFSVVLFYAVSQKEIDARWIRKLRYMPMVMSLGIGLAVNNAHAVLEALIGKGGEFRRTPKYSIGEAAEEWRERRTGQASIRRFSSRSGSRPTSPDHRDLGPGAHLSRDPVPDDLLLRLLLHCDADRHPAASSARRAESGGCHNAGKASSRACHSRRQRKREV